MKLLRDAGAKQGNKLAVSEASDVGQFGTSLAVTDFQSSFLQRSRLAQPQLVRNLIEFMGLELQL